MPVAEGLPRVYRDKVEWAQALKRLRAKLGITQKAAAATCGIPTRTWIAWENRLGVPTQLSQMAIRVFFPELD